MIVTINLLRNSISSHEESRVITSSQATPLLEKDDKGGRKWILINKENISGTLTKFEFTSDGLSIGLEPPDVSLLGRHFKVFFCIKLKKISKFVSLLIETTVRSACTP